MVFGDVSLSIFKETTHSLTECSKPWQYIITGINR